MGGVRGQGGLERGVGTGTPTAISRLAICRQ